MNKMKKKTVEWIAVWVYGTMIHEQIDGLIEYSEIMRISSISQ
jgi:hypothetical protein